MAAASDRRRVRWREMDWRGKDEERSGGVQWPPSSIFSIFPQQEKLEKGLYLEKFICLNNYRI